MAWVIITQDDKAKIIFTALEDDSMYLHNSFVLFQNVCR